MKPGDLVKSLDVLQLGPNGRVLKGEIGVYVGPPVRTVLGRLCVSILWASSVTPIDTPIYNIQPFKEDDNL
jgi:hypothetical protein